MTAATSAQPARQLESGARPDLAGGRPLVGWERYALNARPGAGAGRDVALGHVERPIWRGGIHAIGLAIALPAVAALVSTSNSDVRTRVGVAVYAVGLCLMLAVSATYHRWVHGLRARCAWRRADHAAIFAAIAGSSTPIVLAALPGTAGLALLGAVWVSAGVGAGCKLGRWHGGDRSGTAMYATTIALGSIAMPWVWVREGAVAAGLLIAGVGVYTVGVACFARQWPTLRPAVFSYHEVWHVFTLIAATAQFIAICMLATSR